MSDETSIDGLQEVAAALEALPSRVAQSAVRPALNAGAQVFQAALESTVPRGKTVSLAESLARKISVSRSLDNMSALVGPAYQGGYKTTSNDPGVRGKFLEFGTRKMAPRFWIRSAYEMAKGPATDAAVAVLKAIIGALPK